MQGVHVTKGEQNRALTASTIAFTVCFAVWTVFSIIGIRIKAELGLSDTEFGLLIATPVLTGSLSRIFLGIWSDQFGGRVVFSVQMLLAAAATWLLTLANSYEMYLLAALGVGLAWLTCRDGFPLNVREPRLVFSVWAMLARL
jgi:NNP family nitrate/nitrite transporter-like MFS transporter